VNKSYRGEASKQGWTTEADLLDGIRIDEASLYEIIIQPGNIILKYLTETNKLAGCVYLHKQENKLYLGMLTVSADMQTRGIGKALLYASEQNAKEQGCQTIEMTVITVRHELIAWYERHGYTKTGQIRPFPNDTRFGIPKQPLEFYVLNKKTREFK
jgi:ribosomal protein S18 acetylase RimI-like enzyme